MITLLICTPSSAVALTFAEAPGSPYSTTEQHFVPTGGGFLGGAVAGDFNGDGISDLAVVNATGLPAFSAGESVTVLLGHPDGMLTVAPGSPMELYSRQVDRARAGSKHHLITDSGGIPLAITLTGGNRNDVTQLLPLVDGVGPVRGKPGRPRRRAERVLADRGYDHDKYRRELWKRGVKPVIARRNTEHGSGLGKERWVVERTFAWLHNLRRLRIRYERDPGLHMAFMLLGCAVVCQRKLTGA